jgi:N-acetylmuramoyl-L-alanine amidase
VHALFAQRVLAIRHTGGGSGVGHRVQARNRARGQADHTGMDVLQVGNDLGVTCMGERRRRDARAIVIDAGHAVEQMGEAGCTRLQSGHTFLVTTRAVAELHPDAHRRKRRNQRRVLADLRRQRHHPDRCQRM